MVVVLPDLKEKCSVDRKIQDYRSAVPLAMASEGFHLQFNCSVNIYI